MSRRFEFLAAAISIFALVVAVSLLRVASIVSVEEYHLGALVLQSELVVPVTPLATTTVMGTSTIALVGDLFLGRDVETRMRTQGTSSFPFQALSLPTSTAAVVANFESAMPRSHRHTPDLTFSFSVDPLLLTGAKMFGVTHFGLANNHTLDYGTEGLMTTRTFLEEGGFSIFGDPRNSVDAPSSVIEVNGVTVELIAINGVSAAIDQPQLHTRLKHATSTYQIAYVHWGTEYVPIHSKAQETLARYLVSIGFDAVVGHHPHVIQDIAVYDGVPVFYSLGNFIFDQYFSESVQVGLLLTLTPTSESLAFELSVVESLTTRTQPRYLKPDLAEQYLTALYERSRIVPENLLVRRAAEPQIDLQNLSN